MKTNEHTHNGKVGGLILIGIGVLALLGQYTDGVIWGQWGIYFLSLLGALFLVWGIVSRNVGPLIPGGILSGLGLGIILLETVAWPATVDEGGIFMLAFAAGWGLITVLTAVFTPKVHWWPLIPGAIMAIIGLAVLFGGLFMQALNLMGILWPLLLILLGLFIVYRAYKGSQEKSYEA